MTHGHSVPASSPELLVAPQGERLQVLIVDGDAWPADALAWSLRSSGHQVQVVPDELRAAHRCGPDVVLLRGELPAESRRAIEQLTEQVGVKRPFVIRLEGEAPPREDRTSSEPGIDLHLRRPLYVSLSRRVLWRFQAVLSTDGRV